MSRISILFRVIVLGIAFPFLLEAQVEHKDFSFVKELGGIREYRMNSNDLTVLLMEDHSAPVLTFLVTFNVGSRNEVTGTTGATHILEHLMFKGTPSFNKSKDNSVAQTLGRIGSVFNASTWNDYTNYYNMIPSEHLETVVQLEADRMRNLLLDDHERKSEMTVVRNEFEQGENNPVEALDKSIWATAFQAHPYHHSTIGWKSDIENVPIEKLREFYETFYWPNNATVSVIGDFDAAQALTLIEKHYGPIPRSPKPIPVMYTEEPPQEGPRRVMVRRAGQNEILGVAHKTPRRLDKQHYALAVLSEILTGGKNSRFQKKLTEKGLTSSVTIQNTPFRDAGLFITYATLTTGTKLDDIEKLILQEYENIKTDGVTQAECDAAKAKIRSSEAFARDGSFSIADKLNTAIAMGDWRWFVTYVDEISKVTPDDVRRVATAYLQQDQMVTGLFIPKSLGAGGSGHESKTELYKPVSGEWSRSPDLLDFAGAAGSFEMTQMAGKISDKKISGIRVLSLKTGAKDIVSVRGALMAGAYFNSQNNRAIAHLTTAMLDQGTTKRDKFAIAADLEKMGAKINFTTDDETVNISISCLRDDLPGVMTILAEELRYPLFDEASFQVVKKRLITQYKERLENTNLIAFETLRGKIFPPGHNNYQAGSEQMMKDIEKTTLDDLKAFHRKYYGPVSMVLVAVGDLPVGSFEKAVGAAFSGWSGGIMFESPSKVTPAKNDGKPTVVTIKDKTSVSVVMGMPIGIPGTAKDFVALDVAVQILGGGFYDRLMSTVRDQEGLTYGIYSWIDGEQYSDGYWQIWSSFNPDLLQKGLQSTKKQVDLWLEEGVSEKELRAKKTNMTGEFKVGLSTTSGMANAILSVIRQNRSLDYLDTYPKRIESLTRQEVNDALKKYIRKEHIQTVVAGSVAPDLGRLDENVK